MTCKNSSASAIIAGGLLILAACGGGESATTPATATLNSVTVTVSAASVAAGQTVTATAAGLDQHGVAIATGTVTWSTSSSSVATVSSAGVVTGVAAGTVQVIAAAGGKSGQAALTVTPAPVAGTYRIAFARGSACHRDDPWGCDLYASDVDFGTTAAATATKVAGDADVAEWFPTLSSTGRFVIYNRLSRNTQGQRFNALYAVDLAQPTRAPFEIVANGRFPAISSDDRKLYFSREGSPGHVFVADLTINESAGTIAIGTITQLTTAAMSYAVSADPHPIGLTGDLAFHYQVATTSASVVAVLSAAGAVTTVATGSGHVSVNDAGTSMAFSPAGGGGLSTMTKSGSTWGSRQQHTLPSTGAALTGDDSRFPAQPVAAWSYVEWVDDGHLLVSAQAGTEVSGGGQLFAMSRLYLVTIANSTVEPMGARLGGMTGDYCTATARRLR